MCEYKSEVLEASSSTFKGGIKDSAVDKLNELINRRASEGWELAFQSMALDTSLAKYNILLTFKKPNK